MKLTLFSTFIFYFFCSLTIYGQIVHPRPCFECSDNQALGNKSTAAGKGNVVLGDYSVAFGENNTVSGKHAYAFGYQNEANGLYSGAFGHSSRAEGDYSFVLGRNSISNHNFSTVIGSFSTSSDNHSFIYGSLSEADGDNSFVLGNGSKALATFGFSIGYHVETRASEAFTIGVGRVDAPIVNEISRSLMIGINSDLPSFFIEDSGGEGKTGKIGIGNITAPTAKLHILGDDDAVRPDNASLFIQSAGNYYSTIWLGDTSHYLKTKPNEDLVFKAAGNDFIFRNGNVGIGTERPVAKLDVDGYANTSSGYKVGNNLVINNQSNFVGNDVLTPNGNGYFGGQLFVGDIAIFNDKVGIHENDPSCELDVNGDISAHNISASGLKLTDGTQAIGKILQSDDQGNATWASPQPSDDGDWTISGNNVYRDGGKVGIGTVDPQADLHIVNLDGNVDRTHIKIESPNGNGSGTTEIGRLSGSGPAIIQQAGNGNFTNGGTCTSIRQMSYNNEHGLRLSTFTNTDGSVDHAEVRCMTSSLHAIAKDTLYLRSNESGIEFQIGGYNTKMRLNEYGQLGIGTNTHMDQGETKLTVAGRIHAKEVKVTTGAGGGADFVFEEDYNLPGIDEVDRFIKANKHLPDIPSAEQMQKDGLDLGEMQIKLLQKIEELTLYVIDLKNENEEMREDNCEMKNEIEKLKSR